MASPEAREPTVRVMMFPKDTNGYGTIFGGLIMSHLDIAGAIEAKRHTPYRVVTAFIDRVSFIAPVNVGDVVSFYTRTVKVGSTSVTVWVEVEASRADGTGVVKVTEAEAVFVAIDDAGKPVALGKR